jgi:O-antigen/teichoic acid export membrane protein
MRRSLTKSVAWYSAGNVFVRSASFLLLPLYSNVITVSDFGIYSIIMSFYAVSSVLFQGGLQSAFSKYYIEREEKNEIFSVIMNVVIAWGALILLSVLIFAPFFSEFLLGTEQYGGLFRLITLSLYFETIVFFILHLFKTKEEAVKAVIYTSVGAIVNVLLNIFFVYINEQGITGIIKAQLYSTILTLVILLPYFKLNYKFDLQRFFKTSFFKPLLFFSLPVFISGIFSSFVDVADRFIINNFLGEGQTGLYSFAYRIAMLMNIFVISFRTAFTPYSINLYSSGDYSRKLGKVLVSLLAAGGLIIIVMTFFTDDLFRIRFSGVNLFSENYEGGIFVLPYILGGYFFSVLMSFYSVYPYVSGRSFHFLVSDALSFTVNITLNLVLIPGAGIKGAAMATLFSFMAGAAYLYTISSGKIKINYRKKEMGVVVLSTVIILLAGIYLDNIIADILLLVLYILILIFIAGIKPGMLRLKSVYKAE